MAVVSSAVQCITTDHSSDRGEKVSQSEPEHDAQRSYSYLSHVFSKLEHQITLILHANMLLAVTGPAGP